MPYRSCRDRAKRKSNIMGKNPLISVITPTFNREKFLERAIKSVQKQTYKNWEMVISDDGSTDGTEAMVKKFVDKRIKYLKCDQSGGYLGVPRNLAMDLAQGELLAFLDSDCQFRPDHLQVLWKGLENRPEISATYGDRLIVDEYDKIPSVVGISGDFSVKRLLYQNYIDTNDVLIRRKAFEAVGGWDESLRKFADWNLWVRLGKAGYKFVRIPIIITDYYAHEGMNQLATDLTIKDLFEPIDCKIWPVKTKYGEAKPLKVAIFTLVRDRLDYTKETFESMRATTEYPFDHFIVDNGSGKETADWLDEYTEKFGAYVIRNKENVGISLGSNQALDAIPNDCDIIMKVDNDCRFLSKGWLEAIIDVFERVRSYVVSPYVEGLIDNPGGVPRRRLDNPQLSPYGYIGKNMIGFAPHLGGISIAAPKEAYEGFRWRDMDFYHGIQDVEFSQHCLRQGYALAYLENIKVEHQEIAEIDEREKGNFTDYYKEKIKTLKTRKYVGKVK